MMNEFVPSDENRRTQKFRLRNLVFCILVADLAAFSILGYNCYDRLDINWLPNLENIGKTITAIASQLTFIAVLYKGIWAISIGYSAPNCDDDNWEEKVHRSANKTCLILGIALAAVMVGALVPFGQIDRHVMLAHALCLAFQFLSPMIIQYVCVY